MVFSSLIFLFIYLPIVLLIYFITPLKLRNFSLFIANLVFYGFGEPVYILIMILSIFIDYIHGILVEKYRSNDKKARMIVLSSVLFNLGILIFFKYYDFIITNLTSILPFIGDYLQPLGLALPIGISFYTFQTMSYTIDVYRNDAKVCKNIISFGTYVTLFPQLIAGPIVRYKDVAEQLEGRKETVAKFASGIRLFVIGMGKKVLLANNIGMLWDATNFNNLTVAGAWLGVVAFSFQLYFDFSGYSDMARGLGRMFGFEFLENFNYPYISRSITEFWRRWHISLGTWFREYVYIPLGGNRHGTFKTYRNIFLVWALTGIWHGAQWNFMLWGLYFAVILMIEKKFLLKLLDRLPKFVGHIYTIFLVLISWAIFAVEGPITECLKYVAVMLGFSSHGFINSEFLYNLSNFGVMLIILVIASTPLVKNLYYKINNRFRGFIDILLIILVLISSTAYLVDASYNPFLYFRF